MGNYMGKAMEDNLVKNQQFMLEINRSVLNLVIDYLQTRITLERQIQMQDQMRERMVALQVYLG